jgi:hypothetical protein
LQRRYLIAVVLACFALAAFVHPVTAQTCEGSTGSAMINGSPWSTSCVIALTSPGCIDSLGQEYECFQIIGVDSSSAYVEVALFLAQTPVQGQIYHLGGGNPHGAIVLGQAGLWLTGGAPYTGQVEVTSYNTGNSTITCTFSFVAQALFGADLTVTNGSFNGRLVGIEEKSWSDVKQLYRTPAH